MRRSVLFTVALLAALLLGPPASAMPWIDFTDTFDGYAEGSTIGASDPANWNDASFVGGNAGLLIASAPGGGRGLTHNPASITGYSRSDRDFGALTAGSEYAFGFRMRGGGDAQLIYHQKNTNGWTFRTGLENGLVFLEGSGSPGGVNPLTLTADLANNIWYDVLIGYQREAGFNNDRITLSYRPEGTTDYTLLGSVWSDDYDLWDVGTEENQVLALVNDSSSMPSFLPEAPTTVDDIFGRVAQPVPEPATAVLLGLGIAGAAALRTIRRRNQSA